MSNSRIFQASYPAERMRGCKFATDFRDPLVMARDGWTAFGAPLYHPDGGAILNGTTQYFTRPLAGELYSPNLTVHCECWPDFAAAEAASRHMMATGANFDIYKSSTGSMVVVAGGAILLISALATWESLWLVGQRNLLSCSITNGAQILWLNGVQIDTSAVAYTPTNDAALTVGAYPTPAGYFPGRLTRLYIGHHTSTLAEHLAYWNRTMWNWEDRCNINLMFRMADYDPTAYLTKDSSGHGVDFTLGDGVGGSVPVQGNGRMTYAGAQYLQRASVAQPAGAFSVLWTMSRSGYAGTLVLGRHTDAALTDLAWYLQQNISGAFQFTVGCASQYIQSSNRRDVNVNTVVGTWDGTTANFYYNGVSDKIATFGVPSQPSGAAQTMYVAKAGALAWVGTVFDYKYLDGLALNQTQVCDYTIKMRGSLGVEI
jgi:hypothetical protein